MSADFISIALPLDAEDADALVPELAAAEQEYNGNVYVAAGDEIFGRLDQGTPLAMSPNFPAFVALDRFSAGRRLLGGHAYRWVPFDELVALHELVEELDGTWQAAAAMLDRIGNGERDTRAGRDALAAGIELATSLERGLLLLCILC